MPPRIASLARVARQFDLLYVIDIGVLLFWGALTVRNISQRQPLEDVVRTRSVVIEDDHSRPRIIIGAPVPAVPERRRKNAPTQALVFLDKNGTDTIIAGQQPDPSVEGRIRRRVTSSFGITLQDGSGNERAGFGWLANGRAVIALDRPDEDGWAALVDDSTGFSGTVAFYSPSISARYSTGVIEGTQHSNAFANLKDLLDHDRLSLAINGGRLTFYETDESGRAHELLREKPLSQRSHGFE